MYTDWRKFFIKKSSVKVCGKTYLKSLKNMCLLRKIK